MNVALVSSVGICGIAEHSQELQRHVYTAAPSIGIAVNPDWLDPQAFPGPTQFDLVHLNYHRGLHSRWTPEVIERYAPTPFVITFHDTYEQQPDRLPWDLLALDNVKAMVVHEPCDLSGATPHIEDLSHPGERDGIYHPDVKKVHYMRQAVPARAGSIAPVPGIFTLQGYRPTLGTLGFDFPWKNYDLLVQATAVIGWNLRIVGAVSPERQAALRALNPRTGFDDGFVSRHAAVAALEACDATAFMYTCANSGTSGAIRLGIAAGKPLIATAGCRQFRDLAELGATGICWIEPTLDMLVHALLYHVPAAAGPRGYSVPMLALGHAERWELAGHAYAKLYREAVAS